MNITALKNYYPIHEYRFASSDQPCQTLAKATTQDVVVTGFWLILMISATANQTAIYLDPGANQRDKYTHKVSARLHNEMNSDFGCHPVF